MIALPVRRITPIAQGRMAHLDESRDEPGCSGEHQETPGPSLRLHSWGFRYVTGVTMAKRTEVCAVYRANEDEHYIVSIKSPGSYPDQVDDMKARAVAGVQELLQSVLITLDVHEKQGG